MGIVLTPVQTCAPTKGRSSSACARVCTKHTRAHLDSPRWCQTLSWVVYTSRSVKAASRLLLLCVFSTGSLSWISGPLVKTITVEGGWKISSASFLPTDYSNQADRFNSSAKCQESAELQEVTLLRPSSRGLIVRLLNNISFASLNAPRGRCLGEKKKEKPLTAKFVLQTGNESTFIETSSDTSVKITHIRGHIRDCFSHFPAAPFKCSAAIKKRVHCLAPWEI